MLSLKYHLTPQTFWNKKEVRMITDLSLKLFQQFDQSVKIMTYERRVPRYASEVLTYALMNWVERTVLFLAEHMPEDYVLTMAINHRPWVRGA
jgi:hypothetical protein